MLGTSSLQPEPVMLPERSFGRTARSVAGYALLLTLMYISPLFVFIPAAIFACSARNGRVGAWIALGASTTFSVLIAVQTARAPGTSWQEAMTAYSYGMALVTAVAIPAIVVAPAVRRGASFGGVLVTAVLLSAVGLATTEVTMQSATSGRFSPYAEQVARAAETTTKFVASYRKAGMPSDAVAVLERWMHKGLFCLPGLLLIDIAIVFVLSLVMYGRVVAWRAMVARKEGAEAPAPIGQAAYLFRSLSLPDWLLFAFVIGGLTPLLTGLFQKVTANVLAVVAFLYFLQGLAIFRALLVAVGAGLVGVTFGYLLLAFLTITGIAPLLLSIAGLFDSFFDFRHFKRKDHPDESHPD